MATLPDSFGFAVTVDDIEQARAFYAELCPHDSISTGVFAGIPYFGIMRDGETLVNIFQKSSGNPLQDAIPMLKVDSVEQYQQRISQLGGSVVIPTSTCPCTGASFAVCADANGGQFIVKEARSQ